MFRRTLAAVLTDRRSTASESSIFVTYNVESQDEAARRRLLRVDLVTPGSMPALSARTIRTRA